MDSITWPIAKLAGRARRFVRDTTGMRLKGVGFLLRRLRDNHEFEACGYRWFLDHRIGSSYASLLSDAFEEPGTIALLQHVAGHANFPFSFVDVGANIGEIAVPLAVSGKADRVIAFEPHPVCANVLRRNFALNGVTNAEVREEVVADGTPQPYFVDPETSELSGIRPGAHAPLRPTVRLDDELRDLPGELVLLIDVEGAELEVIKSGRELITSRRPLLIFEYHAETAKRFSLADVIAVIGESYELLRLRPDGRLDADLSDMWNCVAVSRQSPFAALLEPLRVRASE